MQEVIIDIENGTPTVRVRGVKGKGCKDLTRDLESKLGAVKSSVPTAEACEIEIRQGERRKL